MPANLNGASKASRYANKIDSLDSLGTDVSEFSFDQTKVELLVGDFIEEVKKSIQGEDMPVSGAIENISMVVDGNNIKIYGTEYLLYQDKGVNGAEEKKYDTPYSYDEKRPPIDVFVQWIKRKNINLRNNEYLYGEPSPFENFDEDKAIEKLAWAMATKVYKEGFKPRKVFSKHIPMLIENLKSEIAGFTASNIKSQIVNRYGQDVMNKGKKKK